MDPKDHGKDAESPLRTILNYPSKRITPAVPVPDWHSSSPSIPIPSPVGSASTSVPSSSCQTPVHSKNQSTMRKTVISKNVTTVDSESKNDSNVQGDASKTCEMDKGPSTSSKITGEVSITPIHGAITASTSQNPHTSVVPHTPVASGPEQARNSITLQNCVSTVNLGCELRLLDIYCSTRFSEYNPSRFHGVVMRILEPRATALVFSTGKIVCTGAKSEHDSLMAARKFARIIQRLGHPVEFTEFKIQNFVATADLRFPIRLEALHQAHGQFSSYEPELFPGLIYRLIRPRVVLLIFVNGKIVFTGGKTRKEITDSLNIMYPILRSFRKN